ncbi:hypothetical protein E2C01_027497 [Portunus trituberculatus]|uniref:Uncharacterized protein n=1 Tax=Portunus trituberculatus TaxID=210409 RepID=A0A5B7ELG7_PORTR|nr:hypothetical protein [Portunus trituberculatus]
MPVWCPHVVVLGVCDGYEVPLRERLGMHPAVPAAHILYKTLLCTSQLLELTKDRHCYRNGV